MNLLKDLFASEDLKYIGILGLNDEFFSLYVNTLLNKNKKDILIVTSTLYEANKINNYLANYTDKTYLFPMDEFFTSESDAISPDLKITRLETINRTFDDNKKVVVTHLNGLLRYLPKKKLYKNSILNIKKGLEIDREILSEKLINLGYKRESLVSKTGEIGVRGFIIDIFPLEYTFPVRIEFFGDEIESIRYFDEESQKSTEELDEVIIYPNAEFIIEKKENDYSNYNQKYLKELSDNDISSIYDYLDDPVVIFKDYIQIENNYKHLSEQIIEYKKVKDVDYSGNYMFNLEDFNFKDIKYYNTIENLFKEKVDVINFETKNINSFKEDIEAINNYIRREINNKKTVIIAIKENQSKKLLEEINISYVNTNLENILENKVNIVNLPLNEGFIYRDIVLLTSKELFNISNKIKYKTKFKYSTKIKSINNIEIGDYVVHFHYGIGVYNGIKTITKAGKLKDYLEILYQKKDKLYIPVEKIEYISKYSGREGIAPKINKLGGSEWAKTKLRIKDKVRDIADKLLKIYALRKMKKGFKFSEDNELQMQFESEFIYEPTKDQLISSDQIKKDMESDNPMDRLLCADVGYGKTEVAFRAMFKAVNDGKQVLYLCPTTILSKQQYENALERFKSFPVNIGLINRFTQSSVERQIIKDLTSGKLDILFGTHRLLSNDIIPKDLGLLVVDEEQRFGVMHKERIKELKENIDILTLTATPIPRTLQMAMTGLRSLSTIDTPPVDRYPIQTYVMEENEYIIKDAIYKELSRGGQVYILYNRVESIERKKIELESLMPDIKIETIHGQMNKEEIENKMFAFINKEFDILLCTTIIETGIDIENVNTLIILSADRLGLSQLYQIRGRVGRSNKIAYAYLMYKKDKILSDIAVKRLNTIKEFTELGSGYSIASRDLSIRGAGDILGSEQAGFIDNIGIDLYLKILNEEVLRLKGEYVPEEENEDLDESININVDTHISDDYVDDNMLKIEIHKKINEVTSYETLLKVKDELEDRFGRINDKILLYMYEEWFENLAKEKGVEKVNEIPNSIEIIFSEEETKRINAEDLFVDLFNLSELFSFKPHRKKIIVVLDTSRLEENKVKLLIDMLNLIKYKEEV